ncbi:MAG: hypothetical protein CR972_04105 [Candidatus Moraniibacteriota bacterium]|nr:MAG: hypothetical protein CR972_04105 [Candidatus Moranbacteria bacterium]
MSEKKHSLNLFRKIVVIIVFCIIGFVILQPIVSSERFKTRVDHIAGGSLMRSLKLSDFQVTAHKILEQNSENTNLMCLGKTSIDRERNLTSIIKKIQRGEEISVYEKKCIQQVDDGPASFKEIVKKTVSNIKNIFTDEEYTFFYHPTKPGWQRFDVPGTGDYEVSCSGLYSQKFTNRRKNIGCEGINDVIMPEEYKIFDESKAYGTALIQKYDRYFLVNLNIVQIPRSYSKITGGLTLTVSR